MYIETQVGDRKWFITAIRPALDALFSFHSANKEDRAKLAKEIEEMEPPPEAFPPGHDALVF